MAYPAGPPLGALMATPARPTAAARWELALSLRYRPKAEKRKNMELDGFSSRASSPEVEVFLGRDGVWTIETWTAQDLSEWLDTCSPRELSTYIIQWLVLSNRLPDYRSSLRIAIESARRHLIGRECVPA